MSQNWLWGPPIPITTSAPLLDALAQMTGRPMTKRERFEQKVSFVYGQMRGITKEQVREILLASCDFDGDSVK